MYPEQDAIQRELPKIYIGEPSSVLRLQIHCCISSLNQTPGNIHYRDLRDLLKISGARMAMEGHD